MPCPEHPAHLVVLKLLLRLAAALPLLQALPQRHRVRNLGDLEELARVERGGGLEGGV